MVSEPTMKAYYQALIVRHGIDELGNPNSVTPTASYWASEEAARMEYGLRFRRLTTLNPLWVQVEVPTR